MIHHPASGLPIGDPDADPFPPDKRPSPREVRKAAEGLILSASGWRKVFAADGDENSMEEVVAPADACVAALMALVFGESRLAARESRAVKTPMPAIVLGIDSRPTGPALADAMGRVLVSLGFPLRHLFIVAAPEIMAYARSAAPADAECIDSFCYVSASHNPPGHNGVKFGLTDGGVLGKEACEALIAAFRAALADDASITRAMDLASSAPRGEMARIFAGSPQWKRLSHSAYLLFTREVATGSADLDEQEEILDRISRAMAERPLGVVAEMNGSARALSIDKDFLASAGIRALLVNDKPRAFAHRIVPEGESLNDCREALEKAHARDPSYLLGYVPDCDGDRGNLVYVDRRDGRARILEAQEVFALSVLSELAYAEWSRRPGAPAPRVCVSVNDPTSMRIDEIAAAFGAECVRSEVGEANVVSRARSLREEGALVPIMGEGSNGGSIIHPSAVRDPLDTVMAVAKLLAIRDEGARPGLISLWLERSGRGAPGADFGLGEIVDSLPAYATTSVFEPRAALRVSTSDHRELKRRYEAVFRRDFEARRDELATRYGIASWKAISYNGTKESPGPESFADSGSGGLKILFRGQDGKPAAFIWMRGSGTESAFRVMADVKGGSPEDEEYFLSWHAAMVKEADASA